VVDVGRVCRAVSFGDLTLKIAVDAEDQMIVELKGTVNAMIDEHTI
jgi:nitrogen fixation/metabolism regulation signal transduction histidine kinase